MSAAALVACPCCGCRTLEERGRFDICPVCFWESDPVQEDRSDSPVGTNPVSLDEARRNYVEFGACERAMLPHVRPPLESETP
jgi:hypothetical protein